jgi:DNA modification methylase
MKKQQESKQKNLPKYGDVFQIGKDHVIACGDCRDEAFVKKVLDGRTIHAVITDSPYGIAVAESKRDFNPLLKDKAIQNDHLQSDAEYRKFTGDYLKLIVPYLARKNSIYSFNSDKMIFALREGMLDAGYKFSQLIIWVKSHSVMGRMDYLPQHELIAYGWHGVHSFKKSQDKSLVFYPKPNRSPLHPTTKPVGLISRLILNSTDIGDTVYDCFLGSGTTSVSAFQTGRKSIGLEIEPEYVLTAVERMEKLVGVKAEKIYG